ncbi:hypothetical protein I2I05_11535 [Hymenobacter sp. BT683]|uniref:Uncharacterized protein n=1 Tax=Hymenobacter jeongseonensis TaxID=2791027 RepID=A0ABS0II40_9BACT|nr:hypothetical protein [Hymenobacter jeongseonensis]MBF9238026.1 hypothetical protein [Hymenobacter jeongseonensis]
MRYASLLPLALLLGCAATDQPTTEVPVATSALKIERVFDVPALVGMNADQIAKPLSGLSIRPDHDRTPRELPSGGTEALYTYWHDTTALVVSYNPATLRINSYFIKTKHALTPDYTTLLKLANVSQYDKRWSIEPMASVNNPQLYTGVKLVPQQ